MHYGTSHFKTEFDAINYYRGQYPGTRRPDLQRIVKGKIADGEIHIGPPSTKPGEEYYLNVGEGRYFIRERKQNRRRKGNPRGGRFDRCVADVSRSHSALNPYAACASRLKPRRNARRRKRSPDFDLASQLLNRAKRGRHGGLAAGELERLRKEMRRRNPRRKRNVTRRGPRGQLFSLIARKSNQTPMFYTGDKFARHGTPVLFQNIKTAKAVASFMHRQYPSLRGYTIWAREV